MSEGNLALKISNLLYDKKAQDILALRIGHLTVLADYLVIANGSNPLQVRALADHLEEHLSAQGIQPRRVEGRNDGAWVALDYNDVIVHLFKPDTRAYYRLERLWEDGQNRMKLPFDEEEQQITS
jgi:ribosome-associated protein